MLREAILAAVLAGLVAALGLTVLQSIWVTPLILQGEVYEEQAESVSDHSHESSSEHHHDEGAWKPKDGLERTLFTSAANLLMGVGYAFVLIAVYLLWRSPRNALWGAVYGLAGFVVFFGAPALGLPPELPGTAAAELSIRQQWWALTALLTGVGLLLLFSQSRWSLRALAVALLALPHLIAAPHPAVEGSLAPAQLQSQFRLATTLCNALFWLSLGVVSTIAFQKLRVAGNRARS